MSSLYYIQAPMNASKSAQLLMVAHNYDERNYKVLVVKPSVDTRDGAFVKSRALNTERPVDLVVLPEDNECIYEKVVSGGYDVVLVDEAQFLTTAQVDELADIVDELDITVMAYGLRTDAFTNLFEGSKRLFEIADKIEELRTICPCCGKKATVNMRLNDEGEPVFGGDVLLPGNSYLPVCRKHYKKMKRAYASK